MAGCGDFRALTRISRKKGLTLPPGEDIRLRLSTGWRCSSVSFADTHTSTSATTNDCCSTRALWGWSPPSLPADSARKRLVDRVLPRTGAPLALFYLAVFALLGLAPSMPKSGELALDGLAALAAGAWCGANFWRSRHAHCLVTGVGWLALSGFAFGEAILGYSLIHGDEQLVFLAVLVLGLGFEGAWYRLRGTNAVLVG